MKNSFWELVLLIRFMLKVPGKKGRIITPLEGQLTNLRRILLFHWTMACIVCIIFAVIARNLDFDSVIGSVLS